MVLHELIYVFASGEAWYSQCCSNEGVHDSGEGSPWLDSHKVMVDYEECAS
jgi:hypothetical protein